MGGRIWVESEPGKGTSVKIFLQRSSAEPEGIEDSTSTPLFGGFQMGMAPAMAVAV